MGFINSGMRGLRIYKGLADNLRLSLQSEGL